MSTFFLKIMLVIAIIIAVFAIPAAQAQDSPDAWTSYALNLRTGPAITYDVITTLPGNTPVVVEGRNDDLSWLLVHTTDGTQRGWAASLYLAYEPGFYAGRVPVSAEILSAPAPAPAAADPAAPIDTNTTTGGAVLDSAPIIPTINPHMRTVFANGGNDPYTLLKVGDCNSTYWEFLGPLATGDYDLGPYGYLQPTVDHFRGTMSVPSITAHGGYTIYAVLDPMWAAQEPKCLPNETPLACELRTRRPAVAVMMFGANDVFHLSGGQFESALRQVVSQTLANGTIPVLTTFTWCRDDEFQAKGLELNTITVIVGQEFGVPVINFWRAAQALPNCGMRDDTHLSAPIMTTTANFNGEETRTGHTLRNLLTLQTLDAIRVTALQ